MPRLESAFTRLTAAIAAASAELDRTQRALDSALKQPSGVTAATDVKLQLEQLFPADLLLDVDLSWLEHFPRYLRAAQTRITRAMTDPRKDASKLAPFAPLWHTFLKKRGALLDASAARILHAHFEELRVAIFAPELKPAIPVSIPSVSKALESVR
jgi:ATP-dependent helicase HrpA